MACPPVALSFHTHSGRTFLEELTKKYHLLCQSLAEGEGDVEKVEEKRKEFIQFLESWENLKQNLQNEKEEFLAQQKEESEKIRICGYCGTTFSLSSNSPCPFSYHHPVEAKYGGGNLAADCVMDNGMARTEAGEKNSWGCCGKEYQVVGCQTEPHTEERWSWESFRNRNSERVCYPLNK
eukprot:TRINITY_DN10876_c0_g1_i1.p1 TRINITY_DN10876_c0_g1~~TRINITY_DN10876_c0_g1_i1.p1  ORF type:complete len:180 (-),score=54.96 TRINITY_DN10876_c0_g1_i1:8-547(-)